MSGYAIAFGVLAAATWLVLNYPIVGVPLVILGACKIFSQE